MEIDSGTLSHFGSSVTSSKIIFLPHTTNYNEISVSRVEIRANELNYSQRKQEAIDSFANQKYDLVIQVSLWKQAGTKD